MGKIISLKTSQLPREIREQAANSIKNYATVLFYSGEVIGSGTFVQCNSCLGILTAHHVIEDKIKPILFDYSSGKKLGVSIENYPHALEIELQYIHPHEIGSPQDEKYNRFGPDLIFLEILDNTKLGMIKTSRSFWNIPLIKNSLVNDCYDDSNSIWAVCGLPQDWIRDEIPNSNFDKIIGYQCLIGFTGVERRFKKGKFDYFDVAADYNSKDDFPETFKGMSGGGLWKVPVFLKKGSNSLDNLEMGYPIFSGVIFYQTALENNRRILRSHGAKSIYEVFPKALKKSEHRS